MHNNRRRREPLSTILAGQPPAARSSACASTSRSCSGGGGPLPPGRSRSNETTAKRHGRKASKPLGRRRVVVIASSTKGSLSPKPARRPGHPIRQPGPRSGWKRFTVALVIRDAGPAVSAARSKQPSAGYMWDARTAPSLGHRVCAGECNPVVAAGTACKTVGSGGRSWSPRYA